MKSTLIVCTGLLLCTACGQMHNPGAKRHVLQLTGYTIVDGTDSFVTTMAYDEHNHLTALHSNNITGYSNTDSIMYDAQYRPVYFVESNQEDSSVIRNTVTYSSDGNMVRVVAAKIYLTGASGTSDTTMIWIKDGRVVQTWSSITHDSLPVVYNPQGHVTDGETVFKDTLGYANPLILVGNSVFWTVLNHSPLEADSSYQWAMQSGVASIKGLEGRLAQVAQHHKFPGDVVLNGCDAAPVKCVYRYKILE